MAVKAPFHPGSPPRTLAPAITRHGQESGAPRWRGLSDTKTTLPHTDPPVCGGMWGTTCKVPSRDSSTSGPYGRHPTLDPTPGNTWLGGAGRGCLYPGGDTDPKEGPAALALYRGGPGLCDWLGRAAPWERAGGQLSSSPHCPGIVPTPNPGMPRAQPMALYGPRQGLGPYPPRHQAGPPTKC